MMIAHNCANCSYRNIRKGTLSHTKLVVRPLKRYRHSREMSDEIKNFEELVGPVLKQGHKFVSYEAKKLLSAGENYGSVMLQVQVKILNENNEEEVIHVVGKTCPPTEFLCEVFNVKVTFKKEIAVYETIVPALNAFGKEKGFDCLIDFFAEPFASRISLDPQSDVVDKDAILLLENLKVKGYEVCDRFVGFDLQTTKLLLSDLATLHGTVIAYRLEKPKEYDAKIRRYLNKDYSPLVNNEFIESLMKTFEEALASNPQRALYLSKIESAFRDMMNITNPPKMQELFATFTHNDFWVNNTMLKFENGVPVKNKIVDFQVIEYNSLAHDVVFFLYTSVNLSVLENDSDMLFKFYYGKFIEILTKLKCDTSAYTFKALMDEFASVTRCNQFTHILFMLTPIFTLREKAKELTDFKESDLVTEVNSFHENYCKRLNFILSDFTRRGWI